MTFIGLISKSTQNKLLTINSYIRRPLGIEYLLKCTCKWARSQHFRIENSLNRNKTKGLEQINVTVI